MNQDDSIREASFPGEQLEVDVSTPLSELSPLDALTLVFAPRPRYVCADTDHIHELLKMVQDMLNPLDADAVYRCWMAYAAGYTGRRCLTRSITALDFWYCTGRAMRGKHDAPGRTKR
jgi:hypothetical protein